MTAYLNLLTLENILRYSAVVSTMYYVNIIKSYKILINFVFCYRRTHIIKLIKIVILLLINPVIYLSNYLLRPIPFLYNFNQYLVPIPIIFKNPKSYPFFKKQNIYLHINHILIVLLEGIFKGFN